MMDVEELVDDTMPSDAIAAVSYDPETGEVGIQYGYVLVSLPREDFAGFIDLLRDAEERLEEVLEQPSDHGAKRPRRESQKREKKGKEGNGDL